MAAIRPKLTNTGILLDEIKEKTADAGVTIEGVEFKDGLVDSVPISNQLTFSPTEISLGGGVYRKAFVLGGLSYVDPVEISHGISNLDRVLFVSGSIVRNTGDVYPVSCYSVLDYVTSTLIVLTLSFTITSGVVIIEYTKA